MAIENKRMEQKRGLLANFDPSQLLAGEIAITTDNDTSRQRIYYCITPGVVKRLGTYDDFNQAIADYLATYISQLEGYVSSASTSATNAHNSEVNAHTSETNASGSATSSANSASSSANSATSSSNSATLSQSWAIGGTGTRTDEDINNSKYYCDQAKQAVSALTNAFVYMGTIPFADIPTTGNHKGYTYNISDNFVTDSRFKDGSGVSYSAGTNISYTSDGYWDVLGGKMNDYLRKDGDSATNTTTFTVSSTETDIVSGDTHATLFGKILKKMQLIGTVSSLTTTLKTSIVGAINEIVTNIGALSGLNTYVNDTIVNAINWLHTKLINAITPEYSPSLTYVLGKYVFYQGVLYRCITTITTAEAWTASHWAQISFGEELRQTLLNEADQYNTSSTYVLGSIVIYNSILYKCTTTITTAEAWTASHWAQISFGSIIKTLYDTSQTQVAVVRFSAETVYGGSTYIATSFYSPTGKTITVSAVDIMGASGNFKDYISLNQYGNHIRPSTTNASLANKTVQITFTTN